jgi:hypothetical protein
MSLTPERRAAVADALDAIADGLGPELATVDAYDRPDVWTGARATAFRAELRAHRAAVAHSAEQLRLAASMVRAHGCDAITGPT